MSTTRKNNPLLYFMRLATLAVAVSLVLAYLSPYIHPKTTWILPFFGLMFPVIDVLVILLIFFWAIQRSRWALVLSGLVLMGFNFHFRLFHFGGDDVDQSPEGWKVFSQNVRIFDLYNPDKQVKYINRDAILDYASAMDADVYCFQEFYQKDNPTDFQSKDLFVKRLKTPYLHHRFAYKSVGKQHFGIVLFSKHPIVNRGSVNYDDTTANNTNYCIYADIVKGKDTIRFYNVHLQSVKIGEIPSNETNFFQRILDKMRIAYPKRADQAQEIASHIAESPYPVIVCGDFNDTPMSYSYQRFSNVLNDAFLHSGDGIGSTYVGKIPAGRIDYIFHSEEFESAAFLIQENPPSDHKAISCTIYKP